MSPEGHRATKKSKKTITPIKIFKTAQSLGKAKSHIKTFLPLSPHHKKELLLSLANDFGIECRVRQEIANGNKALPQETIDKVKSYYLESFWTCRGRKDFVIVYENNNKEKKQKHYNLYAIRRVRNACLVYVVTVNQLLFSHLRLTAMIFPGGNEQTIRMGKLKSKSLKEA